MPRVNGLSLSNREGQIEAILTRKVSGIAFRLSPAAHPAPHRPHNGYPCGRRSSLLTRAMLSATSPVCHVAGRAGASLIDGDEVSSNPRAIRVPDSHLLESRVRFIDLFEFFLGPLLQRRVVRESTGCQSAPAGDRRRRSRSAWLRDRVPERTARSHVVSCAVPATFEPSRHMFHELARTPGNRTGQIWATLARKVSGCRKTGRSGSLAGVGVRAVRP